MEIVQIGWGLFGQQRVQALRAIANSGARISLTVVDPKFSTGLIPVQGTVGNDNLVVKILVDLSDKALPSSNFDLAIVSVPHTKALEVAEAIAPKTSKLLVEKPALIQSSDTSRWLAVDASTDLYVGYNYRFLPHVLKLKDLVDKNFFGEIRRISFRLGHGGSPQDAFSWKMNKSEVGGGALLDPGSHCLDLLNYIFPSIDFGARSYFASQGFWNKGFAEEVLYVASNETTIATVESSLIRWKSLFQVEVFGSEGYAILTGRDRSYGEPQLTLGRRWAWNATGSSQEESEEHLEFSEVHSARLEIERILELNSETGGTPARLEDALKVVRVVEDSENQESPSGKTR